MNDLFIVIKKEVKELLTLKTVIPIIVLTLMFGFIGQSVGDISKKAEEKPIIGIIDKDNSSLSKDIIGIFENKTENIYFFSDTPSPQEALKQLEKKDGIAMIIIPANFGENISQGKQGTIQILWIMEGLGVMESIPTEAVNGMIQIASENISKSLIGKTGEINPDLALRPLNRNQTTYMKEREFEGVSPAHLSAILSSQSTMIPILILMIVLLSGGQVIQSMGMEKGNKTLETLLTLPVKRSRIAIGKIIGSAVVGLILAGIYMIGFGYYMYSFQPQAATLTKAGLTLGALDYLSLTISLFLAIFAGLSICMLMGSFAEDYRSAQMLMFPLIILVFIPFFLTMFKSFYTLPLTIKAVLFAIPFSHPMMAINFLMFDNYLIVIAGIAYMAIFIGVILSIVSYIFRSDTLITGRFEIRWIDKLLKRIRERKKLK